MIAHLAPGLAFVAAALSTPSETAQPQPKEQPHVVIEVSDSGFHWLDAGIGAAAALAIVLLVVGLALSLRQLKH